MPNRQSEILIQFKNVPHSIFATKCRGLEPNTLIIRLQPEENIRLLIMAKQPGLDLEGVELREVGLNVSLDAAFAKTRRRIAYERLILDLLEGDPTLFVRADEVEAAWAWIDSIHNGCAAARSEEHTSELQSLMRISYAVFCLKKKKYIKYNTKRNQLTTMI